MKTKHGASNWMQSDSQQIDFTDDTEKDIREF